MGAKGAKILREEILAVPKENHRVEYGWRRVSQEGGMERKSMARPEARIVSKTRTCGRILSRFSGFCMEKRPLGASWETKHQPRRLLECVLWASGWMSRGGL